MSCGRKLADGQYWVFCGETDIGQSLPALCITCGGSYKLEELTEEGENYSQLILKHSLNEAMRENNMNIFKPNTKVIGQMPEFEVDTIKDEPMLFSADYEFAAKNGGVITNHFLPFLDATKDWIIDTRVHMLMKDWYPCIGGWHMDNIPRNTENGQPDYKNPAFISDHVLCVIDVGTGSLTEFLEDEVTLTDVPKDKMVYEHFNKEINNQIKYGVINTRQYESGDVLSFDALTFHRGRAATSSGWRFFIRATTNTPQTSYNEIRRQVNVYQDVKTGW